MFKKTAMVMAGLTSFALMGCGPTAEDLVGTWMYDTGTELLSTCNDEEQEPVDLGGGTFSLSLGESFDLISVSEYDGGCHAAYTFEGGELRGAGTEGTCEEVDPVEGVESTGEIYWVYSKDGEVAKLTAAGEITTTYADYDLTCVSRINGAATLQ